jgi:ATP-binding cassette, subfamily B, bacterial
MDSASMSRVKAAPAHHLHVLSTQLKYFPRTFLLIRDAAGRWTIYWAILLMLQGLLPIATVYLLRALVDSLTAIVQAGSSTEANTVYALLGLMIGVQLVAEGLRVMSVYVRTAQSELVQDHIAGLIHRQSVNVDLGFYESPDFYDHLHRAREDTNNRPIALLESTGAIFQNSITLVAMAIVLLRFGIWMPLALLLSALPALFTAARYTTRNHSWSMKTTSDRRRVTYYGWCLTSRDEAAEIRLFQLGDYFRDRYQALRKKLRTEKLQLVKDENRAQVFAGLLGYSVSAASLAWILWRTLQRQLTLGDVALFYQAFNQGQRLMRSVLESLATLYGNSLFLTNLFEFLDLKPKIINSPAPVSPQIPIKQGIRFCNVTFHYPGTNHKALDEFDLTVPAGKIAAIVGPNGAGKSTLIKLMCRFYDPDSGHIELDGINLKAMNVDELKALMTVQFQRAVHYAATAAENIYYSETQVPPDRMNIQAAAAAAQIDQTIGRLPLGYDTPLVTWFLGGSELSIGEWRRISLARALYKKAPILLLDEPTSAMDSWAETNWMTMFRKAAEGRTVILITHRFSTAMHADTIHVMQDGKIVESGNHENLLAQAGLYAESWRNQTQNFQVISEQQSI